MDMVQNPDTPHQYDLDWDFTYRENIERAFTLSMPSIHTELFLTFCGEKDEWRMACYDEAAGTFAVYGGVVGSDNSELIFILENRPAPGYPKRIVLHIPE